MTRVTRRNLLATAAAVGCTSLIGTSGRAEAGTSPPAYEAKPLPFDPGKLKGISEKLIVSHHDKNYAGAVKRLSAIQEKIRGLPADAAAFQMGALKREELVAMNSMILHEYYFDNLGGGGEPGGGIAKFIAEQFGSREGWEHEFKLTGQSLAGGSGWVMLAYSPRTKQLVNVWSSDHLVNLADGSPILVMDMYEHSYQMDYGPDAKAYIDAFFRNINWEAADKRLSSARAG